MSQYGVPPSKEECRDIYQKAIAQRQEEVKQYQSLRELVLSHDFGTSTPAIHAYIDGLTSGRCERDEKEIRTYTAL